MLFSWLLLLQLVPLAFLIPIPLWTADYLPYKKQLDVLTRVASVKRVRHLYSSVSIKKRVVEDELKRDLGPFIPLPVESLCGFDDENLVKMLRKIRLVCFSPRCFKSLDFPNPIFFPVESLTHTGRPTFDFYHSFPPSPLNLRSNTMNAFILNAFIGECFRSWIYMMASREKSRHKKRPFIYQILKRIWPVGSVVRLPKILKHKAPLGSLLYKDVQLGYDSESKKPVMMPDYGFVIYNGSDGFLVYTFNSSMQKNSKYSTSMPIEYSVSCATNFPPSQILDSFIRDLYKKSFDFDAVGKLLQAWRDMIFYSMISHYNLAGHISVFDFTKPSTMTDAFDMIEKINSDYKMELLNHAHESIRQFE